MTTPHQTIIYSPPLFWSHHCNNCHWSFEDGHGGASNPPLQKHIQWHCLRDGLTYNVEFTLCSACYCMNEEFHEATYWDMMDVLLAFKSW